MVALTAFRSMLGRRAETKKGYKPYGTPGSGSAPRAPIGRPHPSDDGKNEIVSADVYDVGDLEQGEGAHGIELREKGSKDGKTERSWYKEDDGDGRPF